MSSDTLYTLLSVFYIFVCLFLIMVVLLQSGRGGGMGALGGGASGGQTVFGGAGAGNFLTRLTAICAALFMILSATLAYLSTKGEKAAQETLDQIAEEEAAALAAPEDDGADADEEVARPAEAGSEETEPEASAPPMNINGSAEETADGVGSGELVEEEEAPIDPEPGAAASETPPSPDQSPDIDVSPVGLEDN